MNKLNKVKVISTLIGLLLICALIMPVIPPIPAQASGTSWEQFHNDAQNTGYSTSTAPDTNNILWSNAYIGAVESSSVVAANNHVFVYCNDRLCCLDESTGVTLWSQDIEPSSMGSWSSPAYHDGKVFINSEDKVYCLNEGDGSILWTFPLPDWGVALNGSVAIADGKVFFADWSNGIYYCLSESDGSEIWHFQLPGEHGNAYSTPAVASGKVLFGLSPSWGQTIPQAVYCVDETNGTEIWHRDVDFSMMGSVAVSGDTVYAATYNFVGDGSLYALNILDGSVNWQQSIERTDSTPVVVGGRVYVCGGCPGYSPLATYCFDASDGSQIWKVDDVGGWTCSLAVADGKVFVGNLKDPWSGAGSYGTYALNADTGAIIWSSKYGGSSPAVANGKAFTIAEGRVCAFGPLPPGTTKITDIRANPEAYEGQTVTVGGEYRGWESGHGSPQTTRSEWVVKDDTSSIYVTGRQPHLDPYQDIGRPVTVTGIVRVEGDSKREQPYIEQQALMGRRSAPDRQSPSNTRSAPVADALGYLRSAQGPDGSIGGLGTSCWVVMAISAAGEDPHSWSAGGDSIVDYLRENSDRLGDIATDWARSILAITAAGENPWNFGGIDYIAELKSYHDGNQIGSPSLLNDDCWGILALISAGESQDSILIQSSKGYLTSNQNADGGWGTGPGGNSAADDTAASIMALIAAGEAPSSSSIVSALDFLKTNQNDDGGFPESIPGPSNSASDSWTIGAILAAGETPTSDDWTKSGGNPVEQLLSLQDSDGAFKWRATIKSNPQWMTAYAIAALSGKPYPVVKISDTVLPMIVDLNPAPAATVETESPTISAAYSDNFSGIDPASVIMRVDGVDITSTATVTEESISYTPTDPLGEGEHSAEVVVVDKTGNPASQNWSFNINLYEPLIDRTPPSILDLEPMPGMIVSTAEPAISANYSDADSGVDTGSVIIKLDGMVVDVMVTESVASYTPASALTEGSHSIQLTVSDEAGNKMIKAWTFTVDSVAPVTSEWYPEGTIAEATLEIGANYSDATSGIDIDLVVLRLDGNDVTSNATITEAGISYIPADPLAKGEHSVEVIVNDKAGNPARQNWSFNISMPMSPEAIDLAGRIDESGVVSEAIELASEDEKAGIELPKGITALTSEDMPLMQISIEPVAKTPLPSPDTSIVGLAYDLQPEGATFNPPITVTFHYDEASIPEGAAEEDLKIAYYNDKRSEWVTLENIVVNCEDNTIVAELSHFTVFAILGRLPSPAAFTISNLEVHSHEVRSGEEVIIKVDVVNTGEVEGSYTAALKINDMVKDTQNLTLPGGANETIVFTLVEETEGDYTVEVDGLSGSFRVIKPAPASFIVKNLTFTPNKVKSGENVTITAQVSNMGEVEGSHSLSLKINGITQETKEMFLASGAEQIATFIVSMDTAGIYSIEIDGQVAEFTVEEAPSLINLALIGYIIAAIVVVGGITTIILRRRKAIYS